MQPLWTGADFSQLIAFGISFKMNHRVCFLVLADAIAFCFESEPLSSYAGEKRSCLYGAKNRKWAITMERYFFPSKWLSK